jgi:hypothetical protein
MTVPVEDSVLESSCRRILVGAQTDAVGEVCPPTMSLGSWAVVAAGLSHISRERGVAALESVFQCQREDGVIPRTVGASDGMALPIFASVFRWMFLYLSGVEPSLATRLGRLLTRLDRLHGRLFRRRDPIHLSSAADERVLSRNPTPDGSVLDVGVNATLVQAETDLMDVAMQTGVPANMMLVRRTRRAAVLLKRSWSADDGLFRSRRGDGWIDPPTAEGLLPLYAGVARPPHARVIWERYLEPGRGFWSPHPLSTLPVEHPDHDPGQPGRGAVCPLLSWMMLDGLQRYGLGGHARQLHHATLHLAREAGIFEAYDSQTGAGIGAAGDPVTAAVILMMLRAPYWDQERCIY